MAQPPKQWKSFDEQLALLQQRGLLVDNPDAAKRYLERLGYYRLSGYWYPFRQLAPEQDSGSAVPRRLSSFIPASHFADVVQLYIFDKKLRLLALDALERIEMAVRVDIAHCLGRLDPHAHENPDCLHGRFSKQIKQRGPTKGKTEHQLWLEKYHSLLHRARREPFVAHYQRHYEKLPIWVAVEVWDFGMMSKLYAGMKLADQNSIAQKYGAADGQAFASWLRSLNFVRNVSAHHSRLWNINVLERAPIPANGDLGQGLNNARPFFYFCLMQAMLRVICPSSSWAQRLVAVVNEFPKAAAGAVKVEDFGVVDGWTQWPLWSQKREPARTQ
ncbi:Abi family protein [Zobellella denitrificans]